MSSKQPTVVPPTQATIKCDGCDDVFDVKWFCKNCPASLCVTCKQRHQTDRFLSKHTVVERTGSVIRTFDSSKIKEQCPEHSESEISMYCNDCSVPCCSNCVEEKHRRHDIVTIQKKYMETEDRLNDLVTDLEKNTLKRLQDNIEELRKTLSSHEKEFKTVAEMVNKFRKELKNAVDTSCDKTLDELNQMETKQCSETRSVISNLENQIEQNRSIISMCGERIAEGGLKLLEYKPNPPRSEIPFVPTLSERIPLFVPRNDLIKAVIENVGEIKLKLTRKGIARMLSSPKPESTKQTGMLLLATPDISIGEVNSFDTGINGRILTPAGNDSAWISDIEDDTMHLYNGSGKKLKTVTIKKTSYINDIAVRKSGEVLVSNDDKRVRLLSLNGEVSRLINMEPHTPKGICLTQKEEIVVCMVSPGIVEENHLSVFSIDGKTIIRKVECRDAQKKQMFVGPTRVVMNGKDISVMNAYSFVVTCDQSGKVKWVYDGSQAKLNQKFKAYGMCIDKFSHLIVSDGKNHCVHYVDRNGGLIQLLLTNKQHGIDIPWGIGVDDGTGRIWCGSAHIKKKKNMDS